MFDDLTVSTRGNAERIPAFESEWLEVEILTNTIETAPERNPKKIIERDSSELRETKINDADDFPRVPSATFLFIFISTFFFVSACTFIVIH